MKMLSEREQDLVCTIKLTVDIFMYIIFSYVMIEQQTKLLEKNQQLEKVMFLKPGEKAKLKKHKEDRQCTEEKLTKVS